MDKPPPALIGLPFKEAAWVKFIKIIKQTELFTKIRTFPFQIVYVECQVILFGIKARLPNCEHREILLNPENNYEINDDDLCVYMCESPREVEDVNAMVRELKQSIKLCDY